MPIEEPERTLAALELPADAEFPEQQRQAEQALVEDMKREEESWLERQQNRLQNFPWGQEQRWDELNPPRSRQEEESSWRPSVYHSDFHDLLAQHHWS